MEHTESANKRIIWIDAAKFAAIMAVYLDHSFYSGMYYNKIILFLTYYHVSLFILLMGITTYQSCKRSTFHLKIKLWKILLPYITAAIIYYIYYNDGLDFGKLFTGLVHFDIANHFYYILVYIQLVLITPVVFSVFRRTDSKNNATLWKILVFIIIIFISYLTTNYTYILNVYGGGKRLFGGTFLILFYIGMWFADFYEKKALKKQHFIVLFITSAILLVIWMCFISLNQYNFDKLFPFGNGLNPPGVTLCIYSFLILLTISSLGNLLSFYPNSFLNKGFRAFSSVGKHTLYMYLYHWLILRNIFPKLSEKYGYFFINKNLTRFLIIMTSIIVPIVIEYIMKNILKFLKNCYENTD